ncbi:MAG: hypothetical protein WC378_16515, partial [Opitutaceae bacterium]
LHVFKSLTYLSELISLPSNFKRSRFYIATGQQWEPAITLLRDYSRCKRTTEDGLSDEKYMCLGIRRALEGDESGRAFLQGIGDAGEPLARTTWFDALQSNRRLSVIEEVAVKSYEKFERKLQDRDWLAEFPELHERAVWAIDGHQR